MLWIVLLILLMRWLGRFLLVIAGNLIHLLLVIALVVPIYQFMTGRRAARSDDAYSGRSLRTVIPTEGNRLSSV